MMLTVFTPTYNRAGYLQRLYESLLRQKSRDFEWLIIDDGSRDETALTVGRMIEQDQLTIRYERKENGGKHTAYNRGLEKARGSWFLCVDADDCLHEDALEKIAEAVKGLSEKEGIAAYKQDLRGNRLSGDFPREVDRCRISDLTYKYSCSGEFTFIFPTALAKKYPFPEFAGEKFVGENVVYDQIEKECSMKLLPEVVTVCEYLEDGYSQNFGKLMERNPSGFCVYFMQRIDLAPSFTAKVSCAGKYWCFRWMSRNKALRYIGSHRLLTYLSIPTGVLFRAYYKFVRGF